MSFILKLKPHLDKILLVFVILSLIVANYSPGTYLVGWDNLMPELNIWMNIKRSFFAVWQEYQGLGLNGGMGHATDLIRQIIILPFTLILPNSIIRYLWHFSMLFVGTFGIYFGVKKVLKFNRWIAFLSSLFYLLNFGTVQNFWPPFEPFSTLWGFFPWLIFSLWQYLKSPSKKSLWKLAVINFLAIPSFYVPTLFIVYLICVSIILFSHFVKSIKFKNFPVVFKNYLKIISIILILNSFWLLPFLYFSKNDIANPQLGLGNFMASEETFLRNQNRGHISDFLLLRGYYYDFPDTGGFLMGSWQNHFSNLIILTIGYTLAAFVIFGLIILLKNFKKLSLIKLSILGVFILSAIVFLSATPPFSWINSLIRLSPLLDQIFRSPFTKFIFPAVFSFTLLFTFSLKYFNSLLKKFKFINPISYIFCFLLIIAFSFPSFTGHFIYPEMRQKIPSDYFQVFNFFKSTPPTSRIMNLPSGSFWGWNNYRYGIRGSGFIWYGIEQPIMDRAFDVWNLKNEQYYHELTFAIQTHNPAILENILKKYSISYVIFDNQIFFPDEKIYAKSSTPQREMLENIPGLTKEAEFGQLYVYKYKNTPQLFTVQDPVNISQVNLAYQDIGFRDYSDYITDTNPDVIFPNKIPSSSNLVYTFSQNPYVRLETHTPNNFYGKYFASYNPSKSYLIEVTYRHQKNYPLIFSAFSNDNGNLFFTTKLKSSKEWQTGQFLIPKVNNTDIDLGMTLLFNNTTFTNTASINDIKSINVYTISFNELVETKNVITPSTASAKNSLNSVGHYFFYKTTLDNIPQNTYLVLPQSFHKGWIAFYFNGIKPVFLINHILANNWSNAWLIPSTIYDLSSTIYVLYWPQLLQFLGLASLIPLLIFLRRSH